ncbi:SMI1/KNR4 family protein [Corallococcus sp. H22C18031201]|nr:SMI1/KNR4 family protein [Corallococcus sp. H22C18031201]
MPELLAELSTHHRPNPPATPQQISEFEARVGWRLDPDLRAFYLHCDGAALFDPLDPAVTFLPLAQIERARVAILQDDSDASGPADWYVIAEVPDTNWMLLDVSHLESGRYPIRDGYREMFPRPDYCPVIAPSFSNFLARTLRSEGRWFWLRNQ